jgi:uncharacterized protein YbjT (DUF2867 family)
MRVVIAGGHGQIALRLTRLLAGGGHEAVGLVRNPDHVADIEAVGGRGIVLDLEHADVPAVAAELAGADAAVFAAGAGPGSGAARKDTVDRAAAELFAKAAEDAGVRRHLQVSAMGLDRADDPGTEPVFAAYLTAKRAAEDDLRGRDLDWTIVRPGRLTDEPGTGQVRLADSVRRGSVSRDDVAAVLVALLTAPGSVGRRLELVGGDTPIADAITSL